MKIFLAFLIVLSYWLLDSYKDVINFNITFLQAIFLNSEETTPLLKIFTAINLFIISLIGARIKPDTGYTQSTQKSYSENIINTILEISTIILSPLSLNKQLNNISYALENNMNFKTSVIADVRNDVIYILNTNESLKKFNIKNKYFPKQINISSSPLDKFFSTLYFENKDFHEDTLIINDIGYRVVAHLRKDKSHRPVGILCSFLDINDAAEYDTFFCKIYEQIIFTMKFIEKKESTFKAQNIFNEKFALIDKDLNIATNVKMQELLVKEMIRAERYNTNLSLIVFEVDYLHSIKRLLSEEELLEIKKEISAFFQKMVRNTDLFGKWNDIQFAIIAPDIDYIGAKRFANKLNRNLAIHRFKKIGKATCSYGITSYYKKDIITSLEQRAQSALEIAVKSGGNKIETKILI